MTDDEMAQYVGIYKNGATSRVAAVVRDGKLNFRDGSPGIELLIRNGNLMLRQGQTEFPVSKIGERRFIVRRPGAPQPDEFVLARSRNGSIGYLVIGDFALKRQD